MPSDISLVSAAVLSPVAVKPQTQAESATSVAVAAPPHASPVSLLDASTGLVVLAFYNDKGEETASLPTKKQLDLYRLNEPSPDIFQPSIRDVAVPPMGNGLPTEA